jgi:hypothetical protein
MFTDLKMPVQHMPVSLRVESLCGGVMSRTLAA